MKILFLSPRQAWPPVSGAKLREFYFARALASEADLHYLYFPEAAGADYPRPEFLGDVTAVSRPRAYTPGKVIAGVFGRWPLPVVNYTSGSMRNAISAAASKHRFDLIHLDAVQLAGYAPFLNTVLPGVPVVYDWHNIESELMERYAANSRSIARALYARFTATRLRSLERWILQTGAGHVVCSERERQQLLAARPAARVDAIDNGVDTAFFRETGTSAAPRHRLVFVGSMSYHANIEAAMWFARHVWPGIHEKFPALRLTLVGSSPAPAVKALAEITGVEVTGTVPDVRPFYAEAIAALAPLRTAGGTRLKILEAMAAGVPVISTALGSEGLAVAPERDFLLAEAPHEWTEAVRVLGDPLRWTRLAETGRNLVCTRYDWASLGRRLCTTYRMWVQGVVSA